MHAGHPAITAAAVAKAAVGSAAADATTGDCYPLHWGLQGMRNIIGRYNAAFAEGATSSML